MGNPWETPVLFPHMIPIPVPILRTAAFPRKRSMAHLGFKSCCVVLRKSLTLSEPEKEEGDNNSFIQQIFIEHLLG